MNRKPGAAPPAPEYSPANGCAPASKDVARLILRAKKHPLGLGFLREGALDSVAAMFQVHAFVVEHAREKLK